MEAPDVDRVGELDHVTGALHVRPRHGLVVCLHVVDGGEVEEVVDLLVEVLDPEALFREIADDGDEPVASPQALADLLEPPARALAHQRVDRGVVAREQLLDEMAPDEARGTRNEVVHFLPSIRGASVSLATGRVAW